MKNLCPGEASNLSRKFSQNQAVGAVGLLSYPESYPCQWRAGVGLVDIRWAHLGDRRASVLEFTCRRIRRTGWAAPHALSKLRRSQAFEHQSHSVGSFAASTVQVPASGCARTRRFPGVPATALPGDSAENVTAPITSAPPSNCAWFGGAPEKAAITIEATGTRFMKMAARAGPSLAIPAFQNRQESTPPPTDIASKAAPARRSGTTKAGPLSSATAVKATAPVVMIPAVLAMPLVSVGTSLRTYTL